MARVRGVGPAERLLPVAPALRNLPANTAPNRSKGPNSYFTTQMNHVRVLAPIQSLVFIA